MNADDTPDVADDRRFIAIDKDIHKEVNKFRLGGESWNEFFKRHLALDRLTRKEKEE